MVANLGMSPDTIIKILDIFKHDTSSLFTRSKKVVMQAFMQTALCLLALTDFIVRNHVMTLNNKVCRVVIMRHDKIATLNSRI